MAEFELKALITGVDKLSPALSSMQKRIAGFQKKIKASGMDGFSVRDLIQGGAFAAPFIAGAKAAIAFESEMADVRKVVDFDTPQQFAQMGEDILKMSERLPMAAGDIAKLVAAGGQAGIDRAELGKFAEDALKMGVAFDQSADESGTMMAKWRTSFKMTQDQVVGLADKINYLSNNGPATAQQISDIVTRIGPLGEVAGLASGQLAAMGATLAGVGVEQEVAATGIKNFVLAITGGSKQQQAAFKQLGYSSKTLASDMQSDAKGTMLKVLTSISKLDKARQPKALNALFGRESIGAIAPLLTNLDLLKKSFDMVGDASEYSGSMQKEYESRAATTANQLQLLRNQAARAGITLGNALLPSINKGVKALMPFIQRTSDFISKNPRFITSLLGAAAGMLSLKLAIGGVSQALRFVGIGMKMSPMGAFLRIAAVGIGYVIANWDKFGPVITKIWDKIEALTSSVDGWKLALVGIAAYIAGIWLKSIVGAIRTVGNESVGASKKMGMLGKLGIGAALYTPIESAMDSTLGKTSAGDWMKNNGLFFASDWTPFFNRQSMQEYEKSINRGPASAKDKVDVNVSFKNAPPGMTVDQQGSKYTDLSYDVGYTSLSGWSYNR